MMFGNYRGKFMLRSKCRLLFLFIAFTIVFCQNGEAEAQRRARNKSRSPAQEAPAEKTRTKFKRIPSRTEFGLGYTLWNERFYLLQSGNKQSGFASFGGFVATLEQSWTRYRWHYGGNFSFGVGKASAGGLSGSFPEGRDRPWYVASFSPFVHYRLNLNFMTGFGLLVRYRAIDWTLLNANNKIEETPRIQSTVVLNLRWSLGRWTLIQSIAPLSFDGDTLWTWTAQYAL